MMPRGRQPSAISDDAVAQVGLPQTQLEESRSLEIATAASTGKMSTNIPDNVPVGDAADDFSPKQNSRQGSLSSSSGISGMNNLQQSIANLYGRDDMADINFVVGTHEDNQQEFAAHSIVLSARSQVFYRMLYGSFKEAKARSSNERSIEITDIEPTAFRIMLRCMYTDEVEVTPDTVMGALYCSKKYEFPILVKGCVKYLKDRVNPETVSMILSQSLLFEEDGLAEACLAFIREHADEIFELDCAVTEMSKDALLQVVADDGIQIEEIKLFTYCIKWGYHQSTLDADTSVHGTLNWEFMKPILMKIRFPLMTAKEVASVVVPHKIVPDSLLVETFVYLTLKDSSTNFPMQFITKPREIHLKPEFELYRSGKSSINSVGNWGYSGAIDAVTLSVNVPIVLNGFGIFPGNGGGLNGVIEIRQGTHAQNSPVIATKRFDNLVSGVNEVERVLFDFPVMLEPNCQYTLVENVDTTQIRTKQFQGSKKMAGSKTSSAEISQENVTFTFSESVNSFNNGTGQYGGQIPSLLWSRSKV